VLIVTSVAGVRLVITYLYSEAPPRWCSLAIILPINHHRIYLLPVTTSVKIPCRCKGTAGFAKAGALAVAICLCEAALLRLALGAVCNLVLLRFRGYPTLFNLFFIFIYNSRDKTTVSSQWDMYQKAAHTKEIRQTNSLHPPQVRCAQVTGGRRTPLQ
jgi:hypothetical protein